MTDVVDQVRTAPPRDPELLSAAERFARRPDWAELVAAMPPDEREALLYRWEWWQRPAQSIPAQMGTMFRAWLVKAGRGFGKTRTGAETARAQANHVSRMALIGATAADVRDVMIEGESGIMACSPPGALPKYEPSKRRLTFPNGCLATAYSAEEPDRLRGPQHEWAWGDEPAAWKYGKQSFDNLMLGLRLGRAPWALLTSTPKSVAWLREMAGDGATTVTNGTTFDNIANLAPTFITDVLGRYDGTRLGSQELYGLWLDDVEGALWTLKVLDRARLASFDPNRPWRSINEWLSAVGRPLVADRRPWRTIVAVDPPGETAECGIAVGTAPVQAVAGRDHGVLLDDMSMAGRPEQWGAQVVAAARKWGRDGQPCVVFVESNQGGDMVRSTVHAVDPGVQVNKIRASQSKTARADPISALDERGWLHHAGTFGMLESQMTSWVPGPGSKSPDRIDARVHLFRELLKVVNNVSSSVSNPNRSTRRSR